MAGISDQIKKAQQVISEEEIRKEVEETKNLNTSVVLSRDEITLILAKFAQLEFKGVEIELTYNLIVKLQETYKRLIGK